MFNMHFVIFIGLIAISNALTLLDIRDWIIFKVRHSKRYSNFFEDSRRMSYYLDNRRRINEHNTLYNSGEVSYRLGINKYSDVPHNEFVAQMNGFKVSLSKRNANKTLIFRGDDNADIPDSIDWRNVGAVTAVKDQERCGSCWSFSSTGVVEGQHFLKTGKLVPLSEQNLIDCSQSYGNQGCNGGLMDQAFQYIRDNKGIDTEKSYRYKAANGACTFNSRNVGATVKSYVDIPSGNEDKLTEAIATIGPIAVAIDASQPSFQNYRSGIYTDENCSSKNLDHGVLAVGYGTDEDGDYYIVKNSWGKSWGESGYIRIARNRNNQCGIATMASFPNV